MSSAQQPSRSATNMGMYAQNEANIDPLLSSSATGIQSQQFYGQSQPRSTIGQSSTASFLTSQDIGTGTQPYGGQPGQTPTRGAIDPSTGLPWDNSPSRHL
jgi:hypothetical protein